MKRFVVLIRKQGSSHWLSIGRFNARTAAGAISQAAVGFGKYFPDADGILAREVAK